MKTYLERKPTDGSVGVNADLEGKQVHLNIRFACLPPEVDPRDKK